MRSTKTASYAKPQGVSYGIIIFHQTLGATICLIESIFFFIKNKPDVCFANQPKSRRPTMKKLLLTLCMLFFFAASALAAVNINTADLKTLESLPGIGASKAQAIIDYRTEHGNFKSIDDLKNVKGIGDKVLEKIKDQIEAK